MSIQKKSLLSSLNATKKAIVASTPAPSVENPSAHTGVRTAARMSTRTAARMATRTAARMATRTAARMAKR